MLIRQLTSQSVIICACDLPLSEQENSLVNQVLAYFSFLFSVGPKLLLHHLFILVNKHSTTQIEGEFGIWRNRYILALLLSSVI